MEADLGGVASVLGYTLSTDSVRPGDTLTVTVYWQPHAHSAVPLTAFVHLVDPARGSLAQVDRYPGQGLYPSDRWLLERPFADAFVLTVPPEAGSAPGANLVLGLYDAQTLTRVPVTGANAGAHGEAWVELGPVAVAP